MRTVKTENLEQDAALQLEVGVTKLKKLCRQSNISRWPFRKRVSLDKLMHRTTAEIGETVTEATAGSPAEQPGSPAVQVSLELHMLQMRSYDVFTDCIQSPVQEATPPNRSA